MTAALEVGEWSAARPGRTLPPGKTRYPLYRRLGGPQGRYGRTENLVPAGIRSRTVQPVVPAHCPLNMGPINCLETSIRNYHYSLGNSPQECSSHLPRGGSLKSRLLTTLPNKLQINTVVSRKVYESAIAPYSVSS